MFLIAAVSLYITTYSALVSQFPQILANTSYHLLFLKIVILIVLIFTFLIIDNAEHLFMCLLALCISSLEKYQL